MKKILFLYTVAAGILFGMQSCNEDIDLIGDFTETAVVYGLLDQEDSIHMIKITRAFIGPGDANQIAGIADSSYFNSVEGTVTEYYVDINGNPTVPTGRSFPLLDTIVYDKEENGIFYAPEQKLYYFDNTKIDPVNNPTGGPLDEDLYYRLDLVINGGEFEVSGGTELVKGMSNTNISSSGSPYKFVGSSNNYISTPVNVNNSSDGTARVINTTLEVEFSEWIGTLETTKSFKWNLGELTANQGEDVIFNASGATFYQLMANNCTNDASIDKRTMKSITTVITGGAEDFLNYIQVNQPSTSLAQNKPTFTNLTATNGRKVVGIFSARHVIRIYDAFYDPVLGSNQRCINKISTYWLCTQQPTVPFMFCSNHLNDVSEAYYCN